MINKTIKLIKAMITAKVVMAAMEGARLYDNSLSATRYIIDPIDEANILAMAGFKKRYPNIQITVASVTKLRNREALRYGFILGADEVILLKLENYLVHYLNGLIIAKAIRKLVIIERSNLVLSGQYSSDTENGAIGPTIASLLHWKQLSNVFKLLKLERKNNKNNKLIVQCYKQNQYANISVFMPCVLICFPGSRNYINMSPTALLEANSKKIKVTPLSKLNVNTNKYISIKDTKFPRPPRRGIVCSSINQLMMLITKC